MTRQKRRPIKADPLTALARASCTVRPLAEGNECNVIERELADLLEARRYFCEWIQDMRDSGECRAATPSQYLRAWNDSTARVIQLLRAHRALKPPDTGLDALLEQVLSELDEEVASVHS